MESAAVVVTPLVLGLKDFYDGDSGDVSNSRTATTTTKGQEKEENSTLIFYSVDNAGKGNKTQLQTPNDNNNNKIMIILAPPLKFEFVGYSVWLELKQINNDLDLAIQTASNELHTFPIPAPHVTVLYGINHLPEFVVLQRFQEMTKEMLNWPPLHYQGYYKGVDYCDADGNGMDMTWMEITHQTSPEHEKMVDLVHDTFYNNNENINNNNSHQKKLRSSPWAPHLSLAYAGLPLDDLPLPDLKGDTVIPKDYLPNLLDRYPTLSSETVRPVEAISLWRTAGTIDCWSCLDRYKFNLDEEPTK